MFPLRGRQKAGIHQISIKYTESNKILLNFGGFRGIPLKLRFCGYGGSWRPHAENLNIPIGILMVWRGPGPPKSHQNMKIPKFY